VERVSKLFMDISEATRHLKKYEDKMMTHWQALHVRLIFI
jgi:hypothetical protein